MATNFLLKRSGTASKRPEAASMALGELDLNYDASTGGVFYKDSAGAVVKVGPAQVGSTAPNASPAGSAGNSVGEFWYDTGASALKMWDGSSWTQTTPSATPTIFGTVKGCTTECNIFLGCNSGSPSYFDSYWNIAIGCGTLNCAYGVIDTVVVGCGALGCLTEGQGNVALGNYAMIGATCGSSNVAIGSYSLASVAGGSNNIAIGPSAANYVADGSANIALGTLSLYNGASVYETLAFGTGTLCSLTFGGANVALGSSAGWLQTEGSCNLILGAEVNAPDLTGSCQLAIGFGATCWLTGDSTGAIKPGAGIIDCAGSCGTAGQVLSSTGVNQLEWITPSGGGGSGTVTSITAGTGLSGGTITTSGTISLDTACVIQPSILTAKGSLISASGASTPVALGVGTNGQVLTACSTCASGLTWAAAIQPSILTAKGSLISASGASTPVALGVGTDGQVLTACSTCASGLTWVAAGGGGGSPATPQIRGILYGRSENGGVSSTSLGYGALNLLGSGNSNNSVAIGNNSLCSMTGGEGNIAIGNFSAQNLVSVAFGNIVIGPYAMCAMTSGCENIVIGCSALSEVSSTCRNIVIGHGAAVDYSGCRSVIIGRQAQLPTNCDDQLFIGGGLYGCAWLTGDSTQAIKPGAGVIDCANSCGTAGQVLSSTGGNQIEWVTPSGGGGGSPATPTTEGLMYGCTAGGNSALGYNALASNLGYSNTAVGQSSMGGITTGYNNVAVGASASAGTLTSSENVTLGSNSGTNLGVSCYNTLVGATTGFFLTTGCYNTLLGSGIYSNIGSGSSNIIISSKDSGGNNNPVYNFSGGENDRVLIGTGETTNAYIQVAWTVVSDARDKMVEGPVPHGLGFVEQLEPKTFYFKENRESDNPNGPKRYGFLAQDILALEGNDAVIIDTEDPEKLKYHGEALVPVLVNAIKELSAEVKSLRAELNQLKSN